MFLDSRDVAWMQQLLIQTARRQGMRTSPMLLGLAKALRSNTSDHGLRWGGSGGCGGAASNFSSFHHQRTSFTKLSALSLTRDTYAVTIFCETTSTSWFWLLGSAAGTLIARPNGVKCGTSEPSGPTMRL